MSAHVAAASLTFAEFERKVIDEAEPLSQNAGPDNLGFGWIYYGLVRNLRPDFVVAIGSCRGFMPFCAARGLLDNGRGKLIFIDPSYAGDGHPGWGGKGLWSDAGEVAARIASFGLSDWMMHLKMTSEEALPRVREIIGEGVLGLVIIDGAHTHEGSLKDFDLYSSLMAEGFAVFHDATNPLCEVARTLEVLRARKHGVVTLDREAGLAIVEVNQRAGEANAWDYLAAPSNRVGQLLPYAREIVRPGDCVLEMYCGFAPLAFLLDDVEFFGWDGNLHFIRKLREVLPQHRWEQIEENELPYTSLLPPRADVLIGLGVMSAGHASWDTQRARENVRHLVNRYRPRACLFEAAADYHDGDIIDQLRDILSRKAYACREALIHTDMQSYARRRILLAERE